MKLSLAQNICRLRKQNGLTQERLAEALGVTFAAVSKWERGVATPDLGLMAELASLFSVSLDALAGFELQQSSAEALARRLLHLQREKRFGEAVSEAEEALRRYPNDFRVVYRCGSLYELAGLEQNRPDWLRRGRDLLERGIPAGPDIGRLLDRLLDEVLEERLANRREDLLVQVQVWRDEDGRHDP